MAFSHEVSRHTTDDWLTPPHILEALGPFDLDPCASMQQKWPTAARMLTQRENGITAEWSGRVWLNPPLHEVRRWLRRMAQHGNGIALTFCRTETRAFFESVWPKASALLFLFDRIWFIRAGALVPTRAPAPSVLIAYGRTNAEILRSCAIPGALVGPAISLPDQFVE